MGGGGEGGRSFPQPAGSKGLPLYYFEISIFGSLDFKMFGASKY